jgi:hypothetical protein
LPKTIAHTADKARRPVKIQLITIRSPLYMYNMPSVGNISYANSTKNELSSNNI